MLLKLAFLEVTLEPFPADYFRTDKISDIVQTEAVIWSCSVKKVFLEFSQNSQENTCARVSFLIKLQA